MSDTDRNEGIVEAEYEHACQMAYERGRADAAQRITDLEGEVRRLEALLTAERARANRNAVEFRQPLNPTGTEPE